MRTMPKLLSRVSTTFSLAIGCQKLGQPVPEFELGLGIVERRIAADAAIEAAVVVIDIFAAAGAFRALLPGDPEGEVGELGAPFRLALDHLRHGLLAEVRRRYRRSGRWSPCRASSRSCSRRPGRPSAARRPRRPRRQMPRSKAGTAGGSPRLVCRAWLLLHGSVVSFHGREYRGGPTTRPTQFVLRRP